MPLACTGRFVRDREVESIRVTLRKQSTGIASCVFVYKENMPNDRLEILSSLNYLSFYSGFSGQFCAGSKSS